MRIVFPIKKRQSLLELGGYRSPWVFRKSIVPTVAPLLLVTLPVVEPKISIE
jgi:hypothetical protein